LIAVALCAVVLRQLGVPLGLALAALALSTAYVELNTAQIVPFALLALACSGLALARRRDALGGALAALTAIEPAAGLPVIAAVLLFAPRARASLLATLLGLGLISLALLGPDGTMTYLTAVLPAHAASEPHFPFQFSLPYALTFLGLSPAVARWLGAFAYLAGALVGLILAPASSRALGRREMLVFLPALCAVIGAPFLHQEELCLALPALLVLAICAQGRQRTAAAAALCALSIPWILVWGTKQLFAISLFACGLIALQLGIAPLLELGLLAVIAGVIYAFELHPPHLPLPVESLQPLYRPNDLAEVAWRDYAAARSSTDPAWLAIKLPAWSALLTGLAIAAGLRARSPRASAPNRESLHENARR
jgi:hypothetical protein